MRLITRKSKASDAAIAWAKQYPPEHDHFRDKQDKAKRLIELGSNPNPDDVDSIIGNGSWTRTKCHQCNAENIDVVELGQEPDYESHTANICKPCIEKALKA
jgi:hypothetical protein